MIKEFLFFFFYCSSCFLIGYLFLKTVNWTPGILSAFIWGIAVSFSVFHIIAYPLFVMKKSFMLLFFLYSCIFAILLCIAAFNFIRSRVYLSVSKELKEFSLDALHNPILSVLFLVLFSVLVYTCIFCYHSSSDDGYYLARSMEVIEQNALDVHPSLSWYGEYIEAYPGLTDASTLAFYIAFFSKLFGISPTLLCRRSFALTMILTHCASVVYLINTVSNWDKRSKYEKTVYALIIYIISQLLAQKVCSAGRWLTDYIWQGKAILIALIFPLLFAACSIIIHHILDGALELREWLSVLIILIAGISVSTVGLFLPAILFFTYGISFLLFTKFKYFRSVMLPAILVVIPVLICAVISYYSIATVNTFYFEIGKGSDWSWWQQFLRASDIFQFVLFGISIIIVVWKGTLLQRILFGVSPIILFLTFLNPLFSKVVSSYITSAEVYWRLFWLLPIYSLPAFVITEISNRFSRGKLQDLVVYSIATLSLFLGYKWSNYYNIIPDKSIIEFLGITAPCRENSYGISNTSYSIANAVIEDWSGENRPHLMTKFDSNFEIRQYSNRIVTYWPGSPDPLPGEMESLGKLASYYDVIDDYIYLHNILEKANVDYVCFDSSSDELSLSKNGFSILQKTDDITLWKVLKSQYS